MRPALTALLLSLISSCSPQSQLPQGPQPYLLVRVLNPTNKLVVAGTIASEITFDFSGESKDHQDAVELHGSLLEKGSSGFRFHWRAVQRTGGREVTDIVKEEFAPWGAETKLESVGGYRISVFYAPKPANEYFTK